MKNNIILFLFLLCSLDTRAQTANADTSVNATQMHARNYLSFSTGINNPVGLLGVSFERAYANQVALEGGLGISTWGIKLNAGSKFYLRPDKRGWAIAIGFTLNTGYKDNDGSAYVYQYGYSTYEQTPVRYMPELAMYIAACHYWRVGRGVHIYTAFGWALAVTDPKIKPINNLELNKLSSEYQNAITFRSPGGILLAAGLSFRLNGK